MPASSRRCCWRRLDREGPGKRARASHALLALQSDALRRLPRLDPVSKDWAGLVRVEVVSGTAEDTPGRYRGFVTVRAFDADGSHMAGQLDPSELRLQALQWLGAAEAAEQDAIVMTMLVNDIGLPAEAAAGFIMRMREVRHELHGDPEQSD